MEGQRIETGKGLAGGRLTWLPMVSALCHLDKGAILKMVILSFKTRGLWECNIMCVYSKNVCCDSVRVLLSEFILQVEILSHLPK